MTGGRSSEIQYQFGTGWWSFECELLVPNLLHHILKMAIITWVYFGINWLRFYSTEHLQHFRQRFHCKRHTHWPSIGVAYSWSFTIIFKHFLPSFQKALDSRNWLHLSRISTLSEDQLLPFQVPSNYSGISDKTISSQHYVSRSRGSWREFMFAF